MSVKKHPYITPTYQANLNVAWRDVIAALSNADYMHAWECLQTFFECVAPPEVEKECLKEYEKLQRNFENSKVEGVDSFQTLANSFEACEQVLIAELRPFCRKVKLSLFAHGYLEKEQRVIPTNSPLFEVQLGQ